MINPTEKDIGKVVGYPAKYPGGEPELGIITSFNDSFVFVRYNHQHPTACGQPTKREDLIDWPYKGDTICQQEVHFQTPQA